MVDGKCIENTKYEVGIDENTYFILIEHTVTYANIINYQLIFTLIYCCDKIFNFHLERSINY